MYNMTEILFGIGILSGLILEPLCDAIMDTISHHYSISKLPRNNWWSPDGWRNKYVDRDPKKGRVKWDFGVFKMNKPVQLTDAWHHFKMWKIIFSILAMVVSPSVWLYTDSLYATLLIFGIAGILRNSVFGLFYRNILKK